MRSATVVLIGFALVAFVSPAGVLAEGALRVDELNELVTAIEAEAEAWATSTRIDVKVRHRLRNVWYDKGSIEPLRSALEVERKSPNDIFVVNRLLSPMLNAKPAVIVEAMGMIHTVAERLARYKSVPIYTKEQLKALDVPEDAPESDRDLADKRSAEKRKKDLAVQKHNQQVRSLRAVVYRLMVRAATSEEDARLLKALAASEKNGDWMYADILEAIRSQARRMEEDRAKTIYEALRAFWNELRARPESKKTYVDQGSVKIEPLGQSHYAIHEDVAKNRTLTVINQVASAARMPALRDPKAPRKPKKKKTRKPGDRRRRR